MVESRTEVKLRLIAQDGAGNALLFLYLLELFEESEGFLDCFGRKIA